MAITKKILCKLLCTRKALKRRVHISRISEIFEAHKTAASQLRWSFRTCAENRGSEFLWSWWRIAKLFMIFRVFRRTFLRAIFNSTTFAAREESSWRFISALAGFRFYICEFKFWGNGYHLGHDDFIKRYLCLFQHLSILQQLCIWNLYIALVRTTKVQFSVLK